MLIQKLWMINWMSPNGRKLFVSFACFLLQCPEELLFQSLCVWRVFSPPVSEKAQLLLIFDCIQYMKGLNLYKLVLYVSNFFQIKEHSKRHMGQKYALAIALLASWGLKWRIWTIKVRRWSAVVRGFSASIDCKSIYNKLLKAAMNPPNLCLDSACV